MPSEWEPQRQYFYDRGERQVTYKRAHHQEPLRELLRSRGYDISDETIIRQEVDLGTPYEQGYERIDWTQ